MRSDGLHLALSIDSPNVDQNAPNYRPSTWPPQAEFPVTINSAGLVVSRFGDSVWDLSPWAMKTASVNFGDGPQRRGSSEISKENADLLRVIAGLFLWGPRSVRRATTLQQKIKVLRPLFVLCSKHAIRADHLFRFPAVCDELLNVTPPSHVGALERMLRALFEQRSMLGFTLFDAEALRRFSALAIRHRKAQTPYIPPRILEYQLDRLRMFLEDFHEHKNKVEACYRYCLDAYERNYGSLTQACARGRDSKRSPFGHKEGRKAPRGAQFLGPFQDTAKKFGVDELLMRWCPASRHGLLVYSLSHYCSMVTEVGNAYLLNFSIMRIEEAWNLRTDCLFTERDPNLGAIFLLKGSTAKTIQDDYALWVTSPRARLAVDAMAAIARMRLQVAMAGRCVPLEKIDIENPFLASKAYEPWASSINQTKPMLIRHAYPSYRSVVDSRPALFDKERLRITQADQDVARSIDPTLDTSYYAVGQIWPLAWHQLRRTGAVNMQASGLISASTLQYQLKHSSQAMSLYYGQGYSNLNLSREAKRAYLQAMYEVQASEIAKLLGERFVSPYGEKRKDEIFRPVAEKKHLMLVEAARLGDVSWRETLLGGCTKRGPCPYGGVDNLVRCGGGDGRAPCSDALFDRQREPQLKKLRSTLAARLSKTPHGTPYSNSLHAQILALENVLDAITQ